MVMALKAMGGFSFNNKSIYNIINSCNIINLEWLNVNYS